MKRLTSTINASKNNIISKIDDRLFSSFIEHMGRAIYTGIYQPDHPTANEFGFRQDVIDLIKPLSIPYIRYPGGNFVSGYRWEDGIGDKKSRPVRMDLAWFALEPNQVGTDDFMDFCNSVGTRPMMAVNLGTGTPQDAVNLLEYCNVEKGTYYSDLRRKNGYEQPHNVKLWCLGNEMDGPWQICSKTAEEYGRIAFETAKMMKWLDDSIELVACGSSYRSMPTYGDWERTVLRHCYEQIDYLSLHQYYQNNDDDLPTFLALNNEMNDFIKEVSDICNEVKAEKHSDKNVYLSFDEWNVWYHFQKEKKFPPKWTVGRPIEEEIYDLADALLVGSMLITLINNADVVKIACLAQLVNTIAPIMTEENGKAWIQTIYFPFLYTSKYGRGTVLKAEINSPTYDCRIGTVPYIDNAVVVDDDKVAVFLVNKHIEQNISCEISLDFPLGNVVENVLLTADNWETKNSASSTPICPRTNTNISIENKTINIDLPSLSWQMIVISK